ncbi:heme-binding beta-barrel domain-containing protein [Methylomarinum vadi]|uniref:heme-binding beta-barrel domain-containing protein n=1 Tax=Methylomarinum vadi TaxID=438855 RepID=UPI0004DEF94A|nr:heme-binding beta-barrel domain-containing protein [Methylomarinum vadi]
MTDDASIDYGPLTELIGVWQGDKGLDVSPEPEGGERNPYYETITFAPIGDVTNAESQLLAALHYRQIVQRKSNDEIFHDETGYWMWDKKAGIVMQSLTIPRGVSVLAGGTHDGEKDENGTIMLEVAAGLDDEDWQIIQSPFMRDHARTTAFRHRITVGSGLLSYEETTMVEIYDKVFEHTDRNELQRQ